MDYRLKQIALKYKIEYINIIPFNYNEFSSVIVALLPYYAGEHRSYLSKYTMGKDYHQVGRSILENIIRETDRNIKHKILIDASPLNEVSLALDAGLGVKGKNGLLINEKFGSFVFILTALTDMVVKNEKSEHNICKSCGICQKMCPGNAISDLRIDYLKCISYLTQKKEINDDEANLIKNTGYVWGCDICQNCCPYNKNIPLTPFSEFKENLLLSLDDLENLSNKEFLKKYGDYSLSYKGKKILKRNLSIIKANYKE